jgi:hypothetical protein
MPKISRKEIFEYLQKSRVIKENTLIGSETGSPGFTVPGAEPVKSVTLNPLSRLNGFRGKTIIQSNKVVDYRVLRRLSEEAWLVNTLIIHLQDQIRPFLKPTTDDNTRGFQVRLKDTGKPITGSVADYIKTLTNFFMNTGFGPDPERQDDIVHFCMKVVRDYLTIDQIATELQRTVGKDVFAFWDIDPATISRVTEEGYNGDDSIRFIQEISQIPTAYYTIDDLIFDYGNPRSDIEYCGYGYSRVESALRLIIAQINTFSYQASALTEDNLPRGMLMLNGDADLQDVEEIEDYIIDVMSGGPMSKWKIPIIPSGTDSEGKSNSVQWVNFRNTNREMEYTEWTHMLWSAVAALFGTDLEEIGIKTNSSTPLIGDNTDPRTQETKSRLLSTILGFIEGHLQKILDKVDDRFDFEFVGYERKDEKKEADLLSAQLSTYTSIDDIRKSKGLVPYNKPWSQMPLSQYTVQMETAAQQQQEMQSYQSGSDTSGKEGSELGKSIKDNTIEIII